MTDIMNKLASDSSALTDSEKGFLQFTPIPIMRMLENGVITGQASLIVSNYSTAIADDVLANYFTQAASITAGMVASNNVTDNAGALQNNYQIVMAQIDQLRQQSYKKLANLQQIPRTSI